MPRLSETIILVLAFPAPLFSDRIWCHTQFSLRRAILTLVCTQWQPRYEPWGWRRRSISRIGSK